MTILRSFFSKLRFRLVKAHQQAHTLNGVRFCLVPYGNGEESIADAYFLIYLKCVLLFLRFLCGEGDLPLHYKFFSYRLTITLHRLYNIYIVDSRLGGGGCGIIMNKKMYTFTFILFILGFMISLFMLAVTIVFIKYKIIPPIIVFLILDICSIVRTCHYYKCWKYLKGNQELDGKNARAIRRMNIAILCIALIIGISMSAVLLYPIIMMGAFFDFQIYFLVIDILATLYFIHALLMDNKIKTCP